MENQPLRHVFGGGFIQILWGFLRKMIHFGLKWMGKTHRPGIWFSFKSAFVTPVIEVAFVQLDHGKR